MSLTFPVLSALAIIIILIIAIVMIYLSFAKKKKQIDNIIEGVALLDKYLAILSNEPESKEKAKLIRGWQNEARNWSENGNRMSE